MFARYTEPYGSTFIFVSDKISRNFSLNAKHMGEPRIFWETASGIELYRECGIWTGLWKCNLEAFQ